MRGHDPKRRPRNGLFFCLYLSNRAKLAIQNGEPDANQFLSGVTDLVDVISQGGLGTSSWISSYRNEVNYQHLYDVWFPLKKEAGCAARRGSRACRRGSGARRSPSCRRRRTAHTRGVQNVRRTPTAAARAFSPPTLPTSVEYCAISRSCDPVPRSMA